MASIIRTIVVIAAIAGSVVGTASSLEGEERNYCVDKPWPCTSNRFAVRFVDPFRRVSTFYAQKGDIFEAFVNLEVRTGGVVDWHFNLRHDPEKLDVIEVENLVPMKHEWCGFGWAGEAVGDPSPGVFKCVFGNPDRVDPEVGSVVPTARIRYRVISELDLGMPTRLVFVEGLIPNEGSPPHPTLINVDQQIYVPETVVDGRVFGSIPEQSGFLRGDTNGDAVVDLSDLILLLHHLYLGRPARFDCDALLDVNADDLLDVSDAVSLINWRFRGTLSSDWLSPVCERGEGTLTCRESNCFGR